MKYSALLCEHEVAANAALREEERGRGLAAVGDHGERGRCVGGQRGEPVLDPAPRQEVRRLGLCLERTPRSVRRADHPRRSGRGHCRPWLDGSARLCLPPRDSQCYARWTAGPCACTAFARRTAPRTPLRCGVRHVRLLTFRHDADDATSVVRRGVHADLVPDAHVRRARRLHHERLLREWMRSSTQIASVSGPSKAGKTVLVQHVVGEGNLITVSGASRAHARSAVGARARLVGRAARDDGEPRRHARPIPRQPRARRQARHRRHRHVAPLEPRSTATAQLETLVGDGQPARAAAGRAGARALAVHDPARRLPLHPAARSRPMSRSSSRMRRAAACGSASRACRTAPITSCARCPSCAVACSRSISTTGAASDLLEIPKLGLPLLGLEVDDAIAADVRDARPPARRSSCSRSACGCATTSACARPPSTPRRRAARRAVAQGDPVSDVVHRRLPLARARADRRARRSARASARSTSTTTAASATSTSRSCARSRWIRRSSRSTTTS